MQQKKINVFNESGLHFYLIYPVPFLFLYIFFDILFDTLLIFTFYHQANYDIYF